MNLRMTLAAALLTTLSLSAHAVDTARIGMDVDAAVLDPRIMRDTTAYRVVDLLFDGLIHLDEKPEPKPSLATSWDRPDPTTLIFHLRDAKFQDGSPVTADDVVFTMQTTLDPKL